MTGGLCIGNEWAGDPARGRRPWRDTMVAVTGPAAAALDDAFARIWRRAGAPLPPDELEADPAECGSSTARYMRARPGTPDRTRMRSEEHTSELQSPYDLVCRLLLEKKKMTY